MHVTDGICIYAFVYIHICVYLYIYIHTYVYIYIYVYIWIYVFMYMYIYIHLCIYVYIYIDIYICIHTRLNIHMYVYIYIYIDICINSQGPQGWRWRREERENRPLGKEWLVNLSSFLTSLANRAFVLLILVSMILSQTKLVNLVPNSMLHSCAIDVLCSFFLSLCLSSRDEYYRSLICAQSGSRKNQVWPVHILISGTYSAWCFVLRCVAVCCSDLQCCFLSCFHGWRRFAVCCSVVSWETKFDNFKFNRGIFTYVSLTDSPSPDRRALPFTYTATHCNTTRCNTQQHIATHCNKLPCTASFLLNTKSFLVWLNNNYLIFILDWKIHFFPSSA